MLKWNWRKSRIIFQRENEHLVYLFIHLFIYLSKSHYGNKHSETTKARNLKFGQIISLHMNLRHYNFGGATSHGMGHLHPKLVTMKFIK